MEKAIKLWCPVTKDHNGEFIGILSDNSMDRDEEFMSKELLQDWAANNVVLPALANHTNKMENFIGGWTDLRVVGKNGHSALVAKPFFFSKEANPKAAQIKALVNEAVEKGLNPGISIGAIPKESIKKDINGKEHTVFTKAELVEATWVPIQSNRNASFGHIARSFNLDVEGKTCDKLEETTMTEEIKKDESQAPEAAPEGKPVEEVLAAAEEGAAEAPTEEAKEEPAAEAEEEAKPEESEAEKSLRLKLEKAEAELEKLKKQAVMKASVEQPEVQKQIELSWEGLMKAQYGGQ